MASNSTATKNQNENANEWGDVEETFLTPVMKIGTTAAFGLLVITRITMASLYVSFLLDILKDSGTTYSNTLSTYAVFSIFDLIGVLAFTGFLAIPALFNSNMKPWARVTFLSVGLLVLAASNAMALFGFTNMFQ